MTAFALFFSWLAALRRGRCTVRDAGLSILIWIEDWLAAEGGVSAGEYARMRNWLGWAEWCARRSDPAAAQKLLRPDLKRDRSPEAFLARFCGALRVLLGAPPRSPRRKRRGGFRRACLHLEPHRPRRARAAAPREAVQARAPP
jgi:hypothetical protein